jgi:transcriptional antiterminator NusG
MLSNLSETQPLGPRVLRDNLTGADPVTQRGGALHLSENSSSSLASNEAAQNHAWFAVQTRSRHEHVVSHHLRMRGVTNYLPTVCEVRLWSDRKKKIETPLFPGYVFVQIVARNERRVEVLRTPGIVRFVGSSAEGAQIPDEQIEIVRKLINENMPWTSHPFLKAGQRVRIRGGALDQVEGIFLKRNGEGALIISIEAIQRSLAVRVQGYDLEVV